MTPCPKRKIKKFPAVIAGSVAGRPMVGEEGFVRLAYIGDDPETEYGDVTGASYPFEIKDILFVDKRDAVSFIKSENFAYAFTS